MRRTFTQRPRSGTRHSAVSVGRRLDICGPTPAKSRATREYMETVVCNLCRQRRFDASIGSLTRSSPRPLVRRWSKAKNKKKKKKQNKKKKTVRSRIRESRADRRRLRSIIPPLFTSFDQPATPSAEAAEAAFLAPARRASYGRRLPATGLSRAS